ncbi:nitrilase [Streptomyces tateyamensis]|uniref:Nitrilase n=1 Tax=Streptomyces tateyamensis TaxID=565073 RepID=A0A2V4MZ60_9ACTN|nr:TIGR03618 family F420-dependent PPOX class oxidoreductase [Streptomyces tateyamensis]PYC70160.1 nitrilase [Streptomyces tateyamensis]
MTDTAQPAVPAVPAFTPEFLAFWTERHICTLTTLRADGSPHVVPVGATYDPGTGIARVITDGDSRKARHVAAAGAAGARVALCQVDGGRWATLEGRAVLRREPAVVADAEERYAQRYRTPRVNPNRVVIEITVTKGLGRGVSPAAR